MREAALIAAAIAAALPVAATARDAAVYYDDGPLRGSLRRNEPAPVYSAEPRDPWNRLFHLLYARKLRAQVGISESSHWRSITRLEGGDLPEFFFPPDAGYLVREPRRSRLSSALEAEVSSPTLRGRSPEARILFQQDLWNRFDALYALAPKDSRAMSLARLVARLMARIALTDQELKSLRPGFAEAARERLDILDLFEVDSPWRELVSYFDLGPQPEPEGGTTMHARRAGWRLLFRRFVRVPPEAGGEGCLREHLASTHGLAAGRSANAANGPCGWDGLPSGTTAILLETALAISAEGELHSIPLVLAAQERVVRPGGSFTVLHAPRLAVSGYPRRLSLESFGEEDLVPQMGSVFPRSDGHPLVPIRQSCVLCHGADGGTLGTASLQLPPRTEVLAPANTVEEGRVLRAKRESESFRALLKLRKA